MVWPRCVLRPAELNGVPKNLSAVRLLKIQCTALLVVGSPVKKFTKPQSARVELVHLPTVSSGADELARNGRQSEKARLNVLLGSHVRVEADCSSMMVYGCPLL